MTDSSKLHTEHKELFDAIKGLRQRYQPIYGLEDIFPWKHKGGFDRRLEIILDFCGSIKDKTFLDVGSCLGYNCFKLVEKGAKVVGIEVLPKRDWIAKQLSDMFGFSEDNPQFFCEDIYKYLNIYYTKYNYILLLNILHHILRKSCEKGWEILNMLANRSDYIFIAMAKPPKECSTKSIPESIIENSSLSNYKYLGRSYGSVLGRSIFVFWK